MTLDEHAANECPWMLVPEAVRECGPFMMEGGDRPLYDGTTINDAVCDANLLLPHLFNGLCDRLQPIDVVCVLAEILAAAHFYRGLRHVEGLPVDCVPDVLPVCVNFAVAANMEFAVWSGLAARPQTDDEFEFINGVHQRYEKWVKEVKEPAIFRTDLSDRASTIYFTFERFTRLGWNIDLDESKRRLERVLVDHVGGDEADPSERETVDIPVAFGLAGFLHDAGVRGAWIASGGAVVPVKSVMRDELKDRVPSGLQRGRHERLETPILSDACLRLSRDPAVLAELRDLRDLADTLQSKYWNEALALAARLSGTAQESTTDRLARVIRILPQHSAPVRAAITYEFFGSQHRQEDVARDFGVSRKRLRANLEVARAVIRAALAA